MPLHYRSLERELNLLGSLVWIKADGTRIMIYPLSVSLLDKIDSPFSVDSSLACSVDPLLPISLHSIRLRSSKIIRSGMKKSSVRAYSLKKHSKET